MVCVGICWYMLVYIFCIYIYIINYKLVFVGICWLLAYVGMAVCCISMSLDSLPVGLIGRAF